MRLILPSRRRLPAKFGWLLLFVLAVAAGHEAIAKVHPAAKHNAKHNEKHEIEALEEQWRVAQLTGDVASIDRLMSADFIGITMTGEANTKAQQLDRFRDKSLLLTKVDISDRKIKLVGDVAIVTALAQVEGTNEGQELQGTYRYTRVYQRVAPGVWQTTNFEVTRIPRHRRPSL
ncbi:MAG: nuclear transport factor 2 family protein [Granulicella sp.]